MPRNMLCLIMLRRRWICEILQVLEMLIAEDDTVPEVWYLLGLALHAGGEFKDALTAAGEAERLMSQRRHEDPDAGETLLDIEDLKVRMLLCTLPDPARCPAGQATSSLLPAACFEWACVARDVK